MSDPNVRTIASYIRPPDRIVNANDFVRIASRRMEADHVRTLVVVRSGQYAGVLEWPTVRRLSSDQLTEPVARFARMDVPTLTPETTIADAIAAFESTDVRALGLLPVVTASGRLAGQLEREEFQGLMTDASGTITVPEDPITYLVTGPDVPDPGAKVVSSDGRKLGSFRRHVEDRGRPRWIEVRHGPFWRRRRRRVPLVAIERQSPQRILLNIDVATWNTFKDRLER